ncbi:MAG: class I SAM-dependent methyltransferase [Chitinophagaceae bacterium]
MNRDNITDKVYANQGNPEVEGLLDKDSKYVLDVGCGAGSLAAVLQAKGMIVDGITISSEEINAARPYLRNAYLQNLENGLPADVAGGYDAVICSHVLEHICYPDKLLKDIKAALRPGGSLIVALPNIMHYKSRMQLINGNFKYQAQGLWDYTHFRWYTFKTAIKLLESHGFVVEHASVSGDMPFSSVFSKVLPKGLRQSIYKGLTSISKGFFGYQLLYKARKKD